MAGSGEVSNRAMTQAVVAPAGSYADSTAEGLGPSLPGAEPAVIETPSRERRLGLRSLALGLGLVRAVRPKQWLKNALVVGAPAAAGVLGQGDVPANVALAFAAFCLVSSGTY